MAGLKKFCCNKRVEIRIVEISLIENIQRED